jgi:hypothetical protein
VAIGAFEDERLGMLLAFSDEDAVGHSDPPARQAG